MDEIQAPIKKEERVNVATELYLLNREKMLDCDSEYKYYRALLECIEIGAAILNDAHFNKIVDKALNDADSYLEKYNIKLFDGRIYQCSISRTSDTGSISVRPEEIEFAERAIREQLSGKIIMRLKPLNNEIFRELLNRRFIKTREFEDEIMDNLWGKINGTNE